MIDQPTIDRILTATNIADVVSDFVTLQRRGVNYVGLCPFHSDKTPSFYVSPAKNICKCFSCGEGGTAVHFIMKHEQLGYVDALRYLAKKYNIEIQERELSDQERQIRNHRESMMIVNGWAQQHFSSLLYDNPEGRTAGLRYFQERGFRDDTIKKFQLGYSLEQRDSLYQAAIKAGYRQEYLEKTGLVIAYENGNVTDRFRGRVLFPIHTLSGKVVAFGGRALKKDEKTAKYINSPESEVYHKSNELYGIYFAKQPIIKADRCFLVEGYTDVISMHQAGIENVVASSGTALTQGQIRLIRRFTNNITVLYDGDTAGIKAAIRGIDMLLEEGMNVKAVLLPNGEDPDSFARKQNATQFAGFLQNNEVDFIRFKRDLLLEDADGDPIKRSALISDVVGSVAIIPDNIIRSVYVRECSAAFEMDEQVLLNEVNRIRLRHEERKSGPAPAGPPPSPGATAPAIPHQPADALVGADLSEGVSPEIFLHERSPFEAHELALLRYVVRYGERVLYDESDKNAEEQAVSHVGDYILYNLRRDELIFHTPLFWQMLEEAAQRCNDSEFVASRYFLSHASAAVSRLAADLISDKYQLSKYHTRFKEIEQEEDKLPQLIAYHLYGFKEAYISRQIKEIHARIKEMQQNKEAEQGIMEQMSTLARLNQIKNALCKELGERIIVKL